MAKQCCEAVAVGAAIGCVVGVAAVFIFLVFCPDTNASY